MIPHGDCPQSQACSCSWCEQIRCKLNHLGVGQFHDVCNKLKTSILLISCMYFFFFFSYSNLNMNFSSTALSKMSPKTPSGAHESDEGNCMLSTPEQSSRLQPKRGVFHFRTLKIEDPHKLVHFLIKTKQGVSNSMFEVSILIYRGH